MHFSGTLETTVNNTDAIIAYTVSNAEKSEGSTMVYLHDRGGSQDDFRPDAYVPELAEHNAIVSFDFPGHGHSAYPAIGTIGIRELAELTDDLTRSLGLGHFALVGHGVGGLVAVEYARRYPGYVSGVVSVEGVMYPEDCSMSGQQHAGMDQRAYWDLAQSVTVACANDTALKAFSALPLERTFIYGSQNRANLPYLGELAAADIEVVEIPNSGHSPAIDNPVAYYAAIQRALPAVIGGRHDELDHDALSRA